MAQIAQEQQQMQTAAKNVAVKLEAFHDGLSSEEQQALDIALRRVGARATETTEDTTGYALPAGALPLIVVRIITRLR